jgi:hypothetical protein
MSQLFHLTQKKIMTVSGSHSGIGKTLLAEYLLSLLQDFAAIKISIEDFFTAVSCDDATIMVPGKDTFRLKTSGAKQVIWVRSPEHNLMESMEQACSLLVDCAGVLIEGNSILTYINPDLAFFVYGGDLQTLKPSRLYALQKARIIINNLRDESEQTAAIEKSLRSLNPAAVVVSLNLSDRQSVIPLLKDMLNQRAG